MRSASGCSSDSKQADVSHHARSGARGLWPGDCAFLAQITGLPGLARSADLACRNRPSALSSLVSGLRADRRGREECDDLGALLAGTPRPVGPEDIR